MAGKSTGLVRKDAAHHGMFGKRFAEAVRRRVYPHTGIHPKQLAHVAGVSIDTFLRWWRGESRVPGEAIDALVTFFDGAGDAAFLHEVFGREAAALSAEIDAMKRRLFELEHRANAPVAHQIGTANGSAPTPAGRMVGAVRQEADGVVAVALAGEGRR